MSGQPPSTWEVRLHRYLLVLSGLATSVLVGAHAIPVLLDSPLWRDEVSSVNVARLALPEAFRHLEFDSFPGLWVVLLKCWAGVAGDTDTALRLLGALVGLAILLLLWRVRQERTPALLLGLVAVNPAIAIYGDTIRAYGIGVAGAIVVVATAARGVRLPAPRRLAAYAVASLLTVHLTYFNALVVLATAVSAALARLSVRDRPGAIRFLLLPVPAALSLLCYVPVWASQAQWIAIRRSNLPRRSVVLEGMRSLLLGGELFATALFVTAAVILLTLLALRNGSISSPDRPCAYFWLQLGAMIVLLQLAFLRALRYPPQPWYYMLVLAVVGLSIEGLAALLPARQRLAVVSVASTLLLGASLPWLPRMISERRTNLDLVASVIEQEARPGDYVLVVPWMYGITFDRYVPAGIDWTTIPPIGDFTGHRYDLLKRAMQDPTAMVPVARRARSVLAEGGRIFWVGALPPELPSRPGLELLPPAPEGPYGWAEMPHYNAWVRQVSREFVALGTSIERLPVASDRRTSKYETAGLWLVHLSAGPS